MRPSISYITLAGVVGLLTACDSSPAGPLPSSSCASPLNLAVGEVREFSGADALSCLVVGSSSATSEYLFTAANATPQQDDLREYLIRASLTPVTALSNAVTPVPQTSALKSLNSDARDVGEFGVAFEGALRAHERQILNGRNISALASRTPGLKTSLGVGSARILTPVVGDTLNYRVGSASRSNLCANFATVRAVVKAAGRRALIVQDVAAPPGGFSSADFQFLAQEFDSVTYPTVTDWFGAPTDINGDGRIVVLITPEINKLTPTGSLGFASGFFYMHDLLAREVPSQNYHCAASNEQEILYLLAPDPTGQVNGNRFTIETARESARGTMAHEMQHMINQGVRQSKGIATLEVHWLNEGLSHFAEEAAGRASRGFTDMQKLDWNRILSDLDDFDSFFRQNLLRLRLWMDRPDLASPISSLAATELAPRGASWALVRFVIDQYGAANPRAFTRALVAGPEVDVTNLAAKAGVPFEKLLRGFLVASYGDVASTTLGAGYRFSSWNMRDVMSSLNGGVFPLRLETFPTTVPTRSLSGSGNYFFVSLAAHADPATFRMLSVDGKAVAFPGARVYVTRFR